MKMPVQATPPIDYGLSTTLLRPVPMQQALEQIAATGIRWVESCANDAHLDPRVKPDVPSIHATCVRLGMEIRCVHLPFRALCSGLADPAQYTTWRDLFFATMEIASELGATIAVTHSACESPDETAVQQSENQRRSQHLVMDLARRAKTLGMRIAVENELTGNTPRWAESLSSLTRLYPDREVGFCLDTGHAIANGQDCLREIESAGDRLIALHLNSNDARSDLHWLPDRGELPWSDVKAALLARFQGIWTLEVQAHGQPAVALAAIARFIRTEA